MRLDPNIADVAASLDAPLHLPITVTSDGRIRRFFAAGFPVTPVNLALRGRTERGASDASIRSYVYAVRLYLRFLATRDRSLLAATDADVDDFARALTGASYRDASGHDRRIDGLRSPATANHILSRVYALFGDIEQRYLVEFEWRRYQRSARHRTEARSHGYRVMTREPKGLPDEQLAKGLIHAQRRWGDEIADGDIAYDGDSSNQRGALLWRNLAIVFLMRFAGARRGEVSPLDITDVDREHGDISLVTKGRYGGRERVVLVPALANAIAKYLLEFRPAPRRDLTRDGVTSIDRNAVFVSHSVANYGSRISAETVRLVVDGLKPGLDEPWRTDLTPHMLRHAFAYDLQRFVGPFATSANLRHRSVRSVDAYRASASQWAADLTAITNSTADVLRSYGVEGL